MFWSMAVDSSCSTFSLTLSTIAVMKKWNNALLDMAKGHIYNTCWFRIYRYLVIIWKKQVPLTAKYQELLSIGYLFFL